MFQEQLILDVNKELKDLLSDYFETILKSE